MSFIFARGVVWHTGKALTYGAIGPGFNSQAVDPFVEDLKTETYLGLNLIGIKFRLNIRIHTTPVAKWVG